MRQSIIASKREGDEDERAVSSNSSRSFAQTGRIVEPPYLRAHNQDHVEYEDDDEYEGTWQDEQQFYDAEDIASGPDDPLDQRMARAIRYDQYVDDYEDAVPSLPSAIERKAKLTRRLEEPDFDVEYPEEDDKYEYTYDEEHPSVRPSRKKKKKLSRRGLLLGAGAAALVGTGVAAYELVPKVPQAVGDAGSNIEKQVQDAFNRGLTQGAEQARKELINSLDNLEGFTLTGAVDAARLTREAYDVFVSPIVTDSATLTGNVLQGMANALKTARGWLAGVYQDNATLAAVQKVLESWVAQVHLMPKQIDSITQTDLDGAQAYLRALQQKIAQEQADLNKPAAQSTVTPTTTQSTTPTPTDK
jgi:hypothetical protein